MTVKQTRQEEIEIDLADIALEIKRNIALILICTLLGLAVVAAWSFCLLKIGYIAKCVFRLPGDINEWQVNTCAEVLRCDIRDGFTLSRVRAIRNSFVLEVSFAGDSQEQIEQDMKRYLPMAEEKLNTLLSEQKKANLQKKFLKKLQRDLAALVIEPNLSNEEAERRLSYLQQQLQDLEADKTFARAELLGSEPKVTEAVPDRKGNLIMGLVGGLFLGTLYVLLRYIIRRSYGAQKA